jgi:hypothetical protein
VPMDGSTRVPQAAKTTAPVTRIGIALFTANPGATANARRRHRQRPPGRR